jgi:F420-non-reducing hydrogenase iron-sulfur subunit
MATPYTEVLVFACNWDGWSCIETAANLGVCYPASVKVVRVSCLSRIHAGLILKAFELGADGVMLLGCEPDRCHFSVDGEYTINEYEKARSILEILGMRKDRLTLVQLPAFNGHEFVMKVMSFIVEVERLLASKRARITGPGPSQDITVLSHSQLAIEKSR